MSAHATCRYDGCDAQNIIGRGLCRKHYQRAWKAGEFVPTFRRQTELSPELDVRAMVAKDFTDTIRLQLKFALAGDCDYIEGLGTRRMSHSDAQKVVVDTLKTMLAERGAE